MRLTVFALLLVLALSVALAARSVFEIATGDWLTGGIVFLVAMGWSWVGSRLWREVTAHRA